MPEPRKSKLATACRWFGRIWLTLAVALILLGYTVVAVNDGILALRDMLSPFNVVNWLAVIVALAPGIAAVLYADKLEGK